LDNEWKKTATEKERKGLTQTERGRIAIEKKNPNKE